MNENKGTNIFQRKYAAVLLTLTFLTTWILSAQIGEIASASPGSVENIAFCGFEDSGDTLGYVTEGGPDDAGDAFGPTTSNSRSGQKSFEVQDTGGSSEYPDNIVFDQVDVSSYDNVWVHVWIDTNWGGFESSDYIKGYVSIDNGAWTEFFYIYDDTGSSPLPQNWTEYTYNAGDNASTVRVKLGMRNSANTEIYYFDDVSVTGSGGEAPPPPGENIIEVTETAYPDLDSPNIENTEDTWLKLIENSENTIDIEAFYLDPSDQPPLSDIYDALIEAADNRGVDVRILVDAELAEDSFRNEWYENLDNHENITVLTFLANITLHSKYMIVDNRVVSVGSTNWGHNSLTTNREVNLTLRGENIADSFTYIFDSGWVAAGGQARGGEYWEENWIYPVANGAEIPENVTDTVDEWVDMFDNAQDNVQLYQYAYNGGPAEVRDAILDAADRGVEIKFMVPKRSYDKWPSATEEIASHKNIHVKTIDFPVGVAHPKFINVDGQRTWVGSANIHSDWILTGREVGVTVYDSQTVDTLLDIFYTDWESVYGSWVSPNAVEVGIVPIRKGDLPGETLQFDVTVANVGEVIDNYDLTVSDNAGWTLSLSENRIENVQPGENETVTLSVTILGNAGTGEVSVVTVTATSENDNNVSSNDKVLALAAGSVSISPTDDSYADQANPDSNYGSETYLEIASKWDEKRRSFLEFNLSDNLPDNALIIDAEFNLYFYWGSDYVALRDAGVLIEAREVTDDSWSESTITWNNAPTVGEVINTSEIGSYGWKKWDVDDYVAEQLENKSDQLASFAITLDNEDFDNTLRRMRFRSEEYSDNTEQRPYLKVKYFPAVYDVQVEVDKEERGRPAGWVANYTVTVANNGNINDNYELTVSDNNWPTTADPTLLEDVFPRENKLVTLKVMIPANAKPGDSDNATITATSQTKPAVSDNKKVTTKVVVDYKLRPCEDDSYVEEANPNTNYGTEPHLEIATMVDNNRRTILKFELSKIPENVEIYSSRLYLYFYWGSNYTELRENYDMKIEAYKVSDDNWSESTLTWNNQPTIGNKIDDTSIGPWKSWKYWDIKSYFEEQRGIDNLASFAVMFENDNFDNTLRRIRYRSKEYTDDTSLTPYLSVWYFPTTVIYDVELAATPEAQGDNAGENLEYTVEVTNLGNVPDSFALTVTSSLGWNAVVSPENLEDVLPNEIENATLTVTIPENAQPGEVDNMTITVTSLGDNTVSDDAVVRAGISQTTTLLPADDAAVFQDSPGLNYGSEAWLEVASAVDNNRRSLLKFDLSSLPAGSDVIGADLNMYFYWGSGFTTLRDAGVLIEAREILDDNWSESTVTWNSAPTLGDLINAVEIGSYDWKVWNVGNFVAQQFENDNLASFVIKFDTENFDETLRRIRFRSQEYSDNLTLRPYLEVEYYP